MVYDIYNEINPSKFFGKLFDFINVLLVGEFVRIIIKITLRAFQNYIIKGFDYTNVYNLIMESFST